MQQARPQSIDNFASLSSLIDASAENEEAVAAALSSTAPRLVLLPSGLTKLISKQSTAAGWRKALLVYKLLPRFGITADLPLFNAALGACEAGRDAQRALQVLADLKAAGCQPDSITFKVLAAACAKAKDWRACVSVMLEVARASIPIEAVTCMTLVAAFDNASMWPLAEAAFLTFFRATACFTELDASSAQVEQAARACGEAVGLAWRAANTVHLTKRAHESSPANMLELRASPGEQHAAPTGNPARRDPRRASAQSIGEYTGSHGVLQVEVWLYCFVLCICFVVCLFVASSCHEQALAWGGSSGTLTRIPMSEAPSQESTPANTLASAMRSASVDFSAFVSGAEPPARPLPATFAALRSQMLQRQACTGAGSQVASDAGTGSGTGPGSANLALRSSRGASATPRTTQSRSSYSSGPLGSGPAAAGAGAFGSPTLSAAGAPHGAGFAPPASGRRSLDAARAARALDQPALFGAGAGAAMAQSQHGSGAVPAPSIGGASDTWAGGTPAQMLAAAQAFGPQAEQRAAPRPLAAGRVAASVQEDMMARACCNSLLRAYARAQPPQSSRALLVLSSMSEAGGNMSPDVVSYNSVFAALAAHGELEHAFTLLTGIEAYGPRPTVTTYALLFDACAAAGAHERALRAWAGLIACGAFPAIEQFNAMLGALVAMGRWQDAWQLFAAATHPGGTIAVDGATVTLLASALAPHLPPRAALGTPEAAPMVGALHHLVHAALAAHAAPPAAALAPLLDAQVQRSDWRAAVVLVGNIVHVHGAAAAADALRELPDLLAAAQQRAHAAGRTAEAEQMRSAAKLVLALSASASEGAGAQ